ncbi:MAG: glycosyltransferase family 4 protein [Spirochaetaceae bacterium]|nr:glycosyltransferase family 4 protein [Spirochaetaceae bacterium]
MAKVLINGYFLCRRITGIERYAYEITRRLDRIIQKNEAAIIIPADTPNIPPYKNLEIIRYKKIKPHIYWQMVHLQWFLLTHKEYTILDFGNTGLPLAPGIVFLHDIYCEFFKEDFVGFRDKLVRIYNRWQYRLITKKAKKIITVSYFIRNQIADVFHIPAERIAVIYSSWNHFREIKADYSVFDDFPVLSGPFYFSLGSLSKRKNSTWIIKYASAHPEARFVLSGADISTARDAGLETPGTLSNVLFLGFLNDEKVKALMERCKAFILPSYYEGFGLTPLEALSCGARIIISNAASLPEIYGKTAHYIDPFNAEVDLDEIVKTPVEAPGGILKKYSYDTAAAQVRDIIYEVIR